MIPGQPHRENVIASLPDKLAGLPAPAAELDELKQVWTPAAQRAVVALLVLAALFLTLQLWLNTPAQPTGSVLDRSEPADLRIDLAHADRAELLQLPGIGENLADRILEHRARFGIHRVEDLLAVPGVGAARLEKLRPFIAVRVEEARAVTPALPVKEEPGADQPPRVLIDVNTASREELQKLPGIGPKLSERIIAERQRQPFKNADDLKRVHGIGPKTVERLRPLVKVAAPPQP